MSATWSTRWAARSGAAQRRRPSHASGRGWPPPVGRSPAASTCCRSRARRRSRSARVAAVRPRGRIRAASPSASAAHACFDKVRGRGWPRIDDVSRRRGPPRAPGSTRASTSCSPPVEEPARRRALTPSTSSSRAVEPAAITEADPRIDDAGPRARAEAAQAARDNAASVGAPGAHRRGRPRRRLGARRGQGHRATASTKSPASPAPRTRPPPPARPVDELRAAVARLGGEVEVAREQLEQAAEEALGAREQADRQRAADRAREDAGEAREEASPAPARADRPPSGARPRTADVARLGRPLGARRCRRGRQDAAPSKDVSERADLGANPGQQMTAAASGWRRRRAGRQRPADIVESASSPALAARPGRRAGRSWPPSARRVRHARGDRKRPRPGRAGHRGRREGSPPREGAKLDDEKVEACRPSSTSRSPRLEEMKAGLTSAGQAALVARREAEQAKKAAEQRRRRDRRASREVFREILGRRPGRGPRSAPHRAAPRQVPRRASRTEITDPPLRDETIPMAVIGTRRQVPGAQPVILSARGVPGTRVREGAVAVSARPQLYAQQQEQFSELIAGELDSVPVQSTYMHGQGLMVPVVGEITAVNGEDGLPLHLLLRAEERERALMSGRRQREGGERSRRARQAAAERAARRAAPTAAGDVPGHARARLAGAARSPTISSGGRAPSRSRRSSRDRRRRTARRSPRRVSRGRGARSGRRPTPPARSAAALVPPPARGRRAAGDRRGAVC